MKACKKICHIIFYVALGINIVIISLIVFLNKTTDRSFKINAGQILEIENIVPITAVYNGSRMSQSSAQNIGDTLTVDLKMFGVIPFSTATVEVVDEMYVAVLGNPFGMKIYTNGVLVIEITEVLSKNKKINPAKKSGLKVGDYIKSVNGKEVFCNEELSSIVENSNGSTLDFEVLRNGEILHLNITPVYDDESKAYRIGIWVRDSSAGIGTLTFYSPKTDIVCGLGHGICDGDTDVLLNIQSGELVTADIVAINKGSKGNPGELKGQFTYDTISDIKLNCECGVYGYLKEKIKISNLTEIALKQEIKDGKAQILCTIEGSAPKLYSCVVKKRSSNYHSKTQNLVITITDKELLKKTGGIVQGMSGSPLLQNGKLIGAVTHVLVDDPTKGYGIFAENMLETAQSVAEQQLKEAS